MRRLLLSFIALPGLACAALQEGAGSSAQPTTTLFSTSTMTITRTLVSAGHTETITSAIASAAPTTTPASSPSTPASSAPAPVVTLSSVILSSTVTAVSTGAEAIGIGGTSTAPYQISGGSNATIPLGSGTGAVPTKSGPPITAFTGAAAPMYGCVRWSLMSGVLAVAGLVVAL